MREGGVPLKRILELDGLRAIAIFGVLLCHFGPQYLGLGASGVDLFFAISGFLITSILLNLRDHEAPYKTFYGRRMLRIFPPYYLVLTLILLLTFLHREHIDFRENIRYWLFLSSAKLGLIKLGIQRLFLQHGLDLPPHPHFTQYSLPEFRNCYGVFWSLSVEELFYLLWAPLILQASRRTILFFSIAPLVICPILRGLVHTPASEGALGFLFRFDALAAGGCIALMFLAVKSGHVKSRLVDRGLALTIIISSLVFVLLIWYLGQFRGVDTRSTLAFSALGYTLLAVLCASVVGACARWSGSLSIFPRVLRSKVAVYLGTVSYMMYLIHMPAYVSVQLMILKFFGKSDGLVLLQGTLAILATIAAASFSWRYFETRILRLKHRQFPAPARPEPALPIAEAATL